MPFKLPSEIQSIVDTVQKSIGAAKELSKSGFEEPPQFLVDEMRKLSMRSDVQADLFKFGRRAGDIIWDRIKTAFKTVVGAEVQPVTIRNPWIKHAVLPFMGPVVAGATERLKELAKPGVAIIGVAAIATHLGAFLVGKSFKK